jgi:hypothetical protein
MQLVGWQHCAGTHWESLVQLVGSGVAIGVGVPYPGPVTHPAIRMTAIRIPGTRYLISLFMGVMFAGIGIIKVPASRDLALRYQEIRSGKGLLLVGAGKARTSTEKTAMGSRRFELLTSAMSRRRHNQLDHEP